MFLIETKCKKTKMEELWVKLGFAGLFVVEPVGRSGGLALLWKADEELKIHNYSRRHINAIVKHSDSAISWKLTGFYGHSDWTKRHESWALMRHLKNFNLEPWLCLGDFNEIITQYEKSRAALRKEGQMDLFRGALDQYCHLSDLGYKGPKFTWTNCRNSENFTKEHLDSAGANISWCSVYRKVEVRVLAGRSSAHEPLLVRLDSGNEARVEYSKGLKVEASWMVDGEYDQIVCEAWEGGGLGGSKMQLVRQKLAHCQHDLSRWSERKFGNAERKLKEKTKQLEALQREEGPEN